MKLNGRSNRSDELQGSFQQMIKSDIWSPEPKVRLALDQSMLVLLNGRLGLTADQYIFVNVCENSHARSILGPERYVPWRRCQAFAKEAVCSIIRTSCQILMFTFALIARAYFLDLLFIVLLSIKMQQCSSFQQSFWQTEPSAGQKLSRHSLNPALQVSLK